jgi:hypothetical protein
MQKGTHRPEELQYWSSVFRSVKATFLLYGCILIQRHAEPRAAFSVRLQKGPHSGPAETNWALEWNTAAASRSATDFILASAPMRSRHLHLAVLHGMQDGELVPQEYLLRVNHPFEAECKCPGWVAAMLEQCNGRNTVSEIMNFLKERGAIHAETEGGEFAAILRTLISSGFLEVADHLIPNVQKQS